MRGVTFVPGEKARPGSRPAARLSFVAETLPQRYDEVRAIFRQRGAWRRYKDLLDRAGQLDSWHAYAEKAQTEALREWATQDGFEPA